MICCNVAECSSFFGGPNDCTQHCCQEDTNTPKKCSECQKAHTCKAAPTTPLTCSAVCCQSYCSTLYPDCPTCCNKYYHNPALCKDCFSGTKERNCWHRDGTEDCTDSIPEQGGWTCLSVTAKETLLTLTQKTGASPLRIADLNAHRLHCHSGTCNLNAAIPSGTYRVPADIPCTMLFPGPSPTPHGNICSANATICNVRQ